MTASKGLRAKGETWKDNYDPSTPLRNPKQEAFAQIAAANPGNWRGALEAGGYKSSAQVNYTRIAKRGHVRARIDWLSGQITARMVEEVGHDRAVTRDEVIKVYREVITEARELERPDYSAICKAAEGLGRSIGMFTERKIVETEYLDFEQMSPEQIEAAVNEAVSRMDPNELRAFLGTAGAARPHQADAVAESQSDSDVSSVSEAETLPSTRH
jgi:hypothetical protein